MATDLFDAAGQRFDVDPNLLRAVFQTESGGQFGTPDSSAGAMGGMQVMPATYATIAQKYGLGSDPRDPVNNVMAGAAVLSENLDQYGNVPDALRAYNGGSPSRWNNPQTAAYPSKVATAYTRLAAPPAVDSSTADSLSGSYQVASADTGTKTDAAPDPNAPPAAPSPSGSASPPSSMSDDALHALLTGAEASSGEPGSPASTATPPPAAAPPASSGSPGAPQSLSDDALHSMLTGAAPAPQQPSAPPPASTTSTSIPAVTLRLPGGDVVQAPWVGSGSAAPAASTSTTIAPDGTIMVPAVHVGSSGTPPTASQPPAQAAAAPAQILPNALAASSSAGLPQKGFMGGLTTVGEGIANAANRLGSYVDQNVPALGSLDRSALPVIGLNQPSQVTAALTPDIAARDQANQGSLAYAGGKLAGDVAATAPAMAAGGALVGGAMEAAPFVGNALGAAGGAVRALPFGNLLATAGTRALTGAATGAAAATLTSGQSSEPLSQQVEQGAALGGVLGTVTPSIMSGAGSILTALKGGTISQETAQLANLARDTYQIPLTAAQISESPSIRVAASTASQVPFSGSAGDIAATQTAFNRAVSQTIGEDATKITPAVMQAARTRLGAQFDQIAGNDFHADDQLVSDLANVETNAQQVLPASEWKPISAQLDNVMGSVDQQGNIIGDAYQVLTRQGAPLDRAQSSTDPNVRFYAGQVRDALDDALARGIPPDQQAALLQARSQWKALKTIEPLVGKSTTGDISPPALMTRVKSSYGDIAYTGGGPLGDLARIGQLIKAPPDSGTAGRLAALGTLSGAGTAVGAAATGLGPVADAAYAAGTLAGTAALARGTNAYLNSPIIANSLIRRGLANNPSPGTFSNALAATALPTGVLARENALRNQLAPADGQ